MILWRVGMIRPLRSERESTLRHHETPRLLHSVGKDSSGTKEPGLPGQRVVELHDENRVFLCSKGGWYEWDQTASFA